MAWAIPLSLRAALTGCSVHPKPLHQLSQSPLPSFQSLWGTRLPLQYEQVLGWARGQSARYSCSRSPSTGARRMKKKEGGDWVSTDQKLTSSHSDAELTIPPLLPALGVHTSPFDIALGSTQVPAESTNFVKDKTGHTGFPGIFRGQGDPRLSKDSKENEEMLTQGYKSYHAF